ncbi:hypothetical protein BH11BAC5_BH11BAC5_27960 [soil metagenome]
MATVKKAAKKNAVRAQVKPVVKKNEVPAAPMIFSRSLHTVRSMVRDAVMEKTTLDTVYIVDGSNNNITLEVNIGDTGQTSNMTIMLDNQVITQNLRGDYNENILGTNTALNGKKLSIVANVADTSRDTNLTSLTIHLKGGPETHDLPLFKTVDEEGGSEDYICLIEFFNPRL